MPAGSADGILFLKPAGCRGDSPCWLGSNAAFSIVSIYAFVSHLLCRIGSHTVPQSVLDAIKLGMWDFEPEQHKSDDYDPTGALPGTHEKLAILSERVSRGLPLWHPDDRRTYDDHGDN